MEILPFFVIFFTSVTCILSASKYPPPCSSNIFCYGDLLHTVQMAKLYKDSKTFVDKKLKYPPDTIQRNFETFKRTHQNMTKADIQKFVDDNFDPEASEFEPWDPSDWREKPAFLSKISDEGLKEWAEKIHIFWKELGRKIKIDVKHRPDLYSMIYVSHPVIVPGGRFREFFYWDSYWIMKGLLLSEMHETVKGMLKNFLEMVDLLGYVPNGGRVYFERSQPPFLIPMFKIYMDATNDTEFLRESLPLLVKEFEFWMKNRTVPVQHNGKVYTLARYNVELTGPRPESYREDYELAEHLATDDEKEELYFNLKAGAESGWDFSSRWYSPPSHVNKSNLAHTKTRDISPVDLNAFLFLGAKLLAEFYKELGVPQKATEYENKANEWKTMINELLYDAETGSWYDYDIKNHELRKEFYATNIAPLWVGAQESDAVVKRFLVYLRKSKALGFVGGIPTSLETSGEQWDFPNGWPPLQHLFIEALDRSGDAEAQELAFELAERWVLSNFKAFYQSQPNHMFEKYDVSVVGLPGGGGEYDVVVGFGWSNGVILDFLNRYGDRLCPKDCNKLTASTASISSLSPIATGSSILGGITIFLASLYGIATAGRRLTSRWEQRKDGEGRRFPRYLYGALSRDSSFDKGTNVVNMSQPPQPLLSNNVQPLIPQKPDTLIQPQIHS